ncbi:hypothetical protein PPROV_000370000 [Pycnococcus provasolii]|uniref:Uncharacterized protein n=1 Tax=Pycnococcus provasolii TaxID=41880 RepID=A0A830HDX7_9CHLO|nr:hypothetical protein PPROV_000370000 [Pycnococcus provasolii]
MAAATTTEVALRLPNIHDNNALSGSNNAQASARDNSRDDNLQTDRPGAAGQGSSSRPATQGVTSLSEIRRLRREQQGLQQELSTLQSTPRDTVFVAADIARHDEALVALANKLSEVKRDVSRRENELARLARTLKLAAKEATGEKTSKLSSKSVNNNRNSDEEVKNVVRVLQEKGTCGQLPPPNYAQNGADGATTFEELSTQLADLDASIIAVTHEQNTLAHIKKRLSRARQNEDGLYLDLKAKLGFIIKHKSDAELETKQLRHMESRTKKRVAEMEREISVLEARRKALLEDQHKRLEKKRQLTTYLEQRDEQRVDLLLELQGDLNKAEEEKLKAKAREVDAKKGVSVIQQSQGKDHIDSEGADSRDKLEKLQREHLKLLQQLSEIQYSGVDFSHRLMQMDTMEEQLDVTEARCKESRTALETLTEMFPPINLGLDFIRNKLDGLRSGQKVAGRTRGQSVAARAASAEEAAADTGEGRAVGFADDTGGEPLPSARGENAELASGEGDGAGAGATGAAPAASVVESLETIETKLVAMLEKINAESDANPAVAAAVASAANRVPTQTMMPATNVRVREPVAAGSGAAAAGGSRSGRGATNDEDNEPEPIEEMSASHRLAEDGRPKTVGEDVLDLLDKNRETDVAGLHQASRLRMKQIERDERRRQAKLEKEREKLARLGRA